MVATGGSPREKPGQWVLAINPAGKLCKRPSSLKARMASPILGSLRVLGGKEESTAGQVKQVKVKHRWSRWSRAGEEQHRGLSWRKSSAGRILRGFWGLLSPQRNLRSLAFEMQMNLPSQGMIKCWRMVSLSETNWKTANGGRTKLLTLWDSFFFSLLFFLLFLVT